MSKVDDGTPLVDIQEEPFNEKNLEHVKSGTQVQPVKDNRLGIFFALGASLCYAFGNIVTLYLTARVGMKAIFYQAYGSLSTWIIYRGVKLIIRCRDGPNEDDILTYWDRVDDGAEGREPQYRASCFKMVQPLIAAIQNTQSQAFVFLTMFFLSRTSVSVNSGVVCSLFSSSLIFVALLFRCLYSQKLSWLTGVGIILILASVPLIAMDAKQDDKKAGADPLKKTSAFDYMLLWALFSAILAGFSFSLGVTVVRFVMNRTPEVNLSTIFTDCNIILGVVYLPFLIYELSTNEAARTGAAANFGFAMGGFWLINIGTILSAYSIKFGTGAIVQGVENLKFCEQVIIEMIMSGFHKLPTGFQIGGLVSGFVGGVIIICESNRSKE